MGNPYETVDGVIKVKMKCLLDSKEGKRVIAIDLDVMVNQHALLVLCIFWLLLLHGSLVPSNEALGTRVAIVEVQEPVVSFV